MAYSVSLRILLNVSIYALQKSEHLMYVVKDNTSRQKRHNVVYAKINILNIHHKC